MNTSSARLLLFALALATSNQAALCEHALFTRHTDTISIPGNSVVGEAMTFEALFMLLDGYPHGGWIFQEWTSGAEDKGLLVSKNFAGGRYWPEGPLYRRLELQPSVWHHLALVVELGQARLYLNGILAAAADSTQLVGNGNSPAAIGAYFRNGSFRPGFIGYLDAFRLSDVARYSGLKFERVEDAFQPDSNTLVLYNFDEVGSEGTVLDDSPLGRNGRLGHGFDGATAPLLVPSVIDTPMSHATFIQVDPRASYLRVQRDAAFRTIPIDLEAAGFREGDSLFLQSVGDYNRNNTTTPSESPERLGAVFSATEEMLPGDVINRLPGAIAAGSPVSSQLTWREKLQTDIPEDFEIPLRGTVVRVPEGARFLFVGVLDDFFVDNMDADANYGVHLSLFEPRLMHSDNGFCIEWDIGVLQSRKAFDIQPWQQAPISNGRLFLPKQPVEEMDFFQLKW